MVDMTVLDVYKCQDLGRRGGGLFDSFLFLQLLDDTALKFSEVIIPPAPTYHKRSLFSLVPPPSALIVVWFERPGY